MRTTATVGHDDLLITLESKAAPEHTALLIIDVQNDFVAEGGFFHRIGADVAAIQKAVPPLVQLIASARAAGVLTIFVQAIYDPRYVSAPMRERNVRRRMEIPRCLTGSWGADFFTVRPLPGEPLVVKHRYSAYTNPQLKELLDRHGIRSLLVTGVSTDTCVESTARDFYFADYYVTMVGDCCAAASKRDHESALERFDRDYGEVTTSAELVRIWRNAKASAPAGTETDAHA